MKLHDFNGIVVRSQLFKNEFDSPINVYFHRDDIFKTVNLSEERQFEFKTFFRFTLNELNHEGIAYLNHFSVKKAIKEFPEFYEIEDWITEENDKTVQEYRNYRLSLLSEEKRLRAIEQKKKRIDRAKLKEKEKIKAEKKKAKEKEKAKIKAQKEREKLNEKKKKEREKLKIKKEKEKEKLRLKKLKQQKT